MTDRFLKTKVLGQGGFGKVFEAVDLQTGHTVALKEMYGQIDNWEQCCSLPEVKALQELNHPNIANLKEVMLQDKKLLLVYELLEKDLYKLIEEKRNAKLDVGEGMVRVYAYQILKGLAYIHKRGYIHRDLKPENLLLLGNDLLKITDFGIIKDLSRAVEGPFTEYVSTRWYRAPEIVLR